MKSFPLNKCLSCLFVIVVLAGCSPTKTEPTTKPAESLSPATPTLLTTPAPSPTVSATDPPAVVPTTPPLQVITLEGTSAPPIVFTSQPATPTATPQPTLKTTNFPEARIQIKYPADLSQLVSPFTVYGDLLPGFGNKVSIQLLGEDGRTLYSEEIRMMQSASGWVTLNQKIDFLIPSAGETALLVVFTRDEFGRLIAQSTAKVFLMQIGRNDIKTNTFIQQPFVIQSPREESKTTGGTLRVRGFIHAYNLNPLIIEVQSESGEILVSKTLDVPESALQVEFISFFADIPYEVSQTTSARLIIRQKSEMLPEIDVALASRTIILSP